jgi:hypothetical protein
VNYFHAESVPTGNTATTMIPADFAPRRRLGSRAEARSVLDDTIEQCSTTLTIFDDCGQFYGFERLSFAIALATFLSQDRGTSATIIVHDPSYLERHCPRIVAMMRQYGPQLRVLQTEPALHSFARGLVVADHGVVLRRPHFDQATTFLDYDPQALIDATRLIDEIKLLTRPTAIGQATGL